MSTCTASHPAVAPLDFGSQDLSAAEVRERFRWAKRQGRPAWLWPETPVEAWREALCDIERAVRGVLSGAAPVPRLDGDPAALGLAGYTCGLGPLLGWWSERGVLHAAPAVAAVLELHLRHNRLRAARMQAAAAALVAVLLRRGIAVAVLKGAHTGLAYFPDPATRPASDVDLLVRPADAAAAEAVLRGEGLVEGSRGPFESSWSPASAAPGPRSLRLVHADDPWSVDLHGSLDLVISGGAPLARLQAGSPMAGRIPWPPCPGAKTLDQPLLLLHLAVHAGSGLQNLTLLRLVELGLVIRQDAAAGRLSWNAFLQTARRTSALGFAYPALKLCEDLTPGTVPAFVLEDCARHAPAGVRAVADRLTPATAQRIERSSVEEHFMWTDGWGGRMRQIAADIAPDVASWDKLWSIWEKRAWRLVRGRLSR